MQLRSGAGAISAAIALAALLALQACAASGACNTMGYAYRGPVTLEVPGQSATTAEVLACFGEDCTPVPAEASGRGWALDLGESVGLGGPDHPSAVTAIVIAVETGTELTRGVYPITYKRTGGSRSCPGPTAPEPVVIGSG